MWSNIEYHHAVELIEYTKKVIAVQIFPMILVKIIREILIYWQQSINYLVCEICYNLLCLIDCDICFIDCENVIKCYKY